MHPISCVAVAASQIYGVEKNISLSRIPYTRKILAKSLNLRLRSQELNRLFLH